jgi:hypothetical protein
LVNDVIFGTNEIPVIVGDHLVEHYLITKIYIFNPYTAPYTELIMLRIRSFFYSVYGAVYGADDAPYTAPYTELRIWTSVYGDSVYGAVYGDFRPKYGVYPHHIRSFFTTFLVKYGVFAPYTEF